MQGIYKITNLLNKKSYIGKSNNIERRFKDHIRLAFTENHKEYNKSLYQAFRKYGIQNFSFNVIEELKDYNLASQREKYWINYYQTFTNGYNESLGGDGGSSKGHCQGKNNGRAKLTQQDVIFIRTKYKQGCSKKDCYEYFKDKISQSGFAKIWLGKTWQYIMPEVFTIENKQRNEKMGKGTSNKNKRILTDSEVKKIRKQKQEGMTYEEIVKNLNNKISISTAKDIINYRTYKEVK